MKVSIITCTYNSASTIVETVASITNQTYPDIEYIIIDGNSEDRTLELAKASSDRIALIISEPDKGIYDALNKGLKKSSGDIIGLLHSDDELTSDTIIEEVIKKFNQTSADIVYGDLIYVSNMNKDKIVRYWKGNPFDRNLINKGWMPAHPAMFIRRDVYLKYGPYDIQYHISADYDLILRLMQISDLKIEYLPRVITKMRKGGVSNRNLRNIFLKSREDYRIIKKNGLPNALTVLIRKNIVKRIWRII